jgi:hypothetical protein
MSRRGRKPLHPHFETLLRRAARVEVIRLEAFYRDDIELWKRAVDVAAQISRLIETSPYR